MCQKLITVVNVDKVSLCSLHIERSLSKCRHRKW